MEKSLTLSGKAMLNNHLDKTVINYNNALDSKSSKANQLMGEMEKLNPELATKEKIEGHARQFRLATSENDTQTAKNHLDELRNLDPKRAIKEET